MDASVWVSRFVQVDVTHTASRSWIEACLGRDTLLVAPALLLPEVAGAVSRRTGVPALGERAANLIEQLPGVRLVPLDADLAPLSANLAAKHQLRGADAVYIALAQYLGLPLVTWDREQVERGGRVVLALAPKAAADRDN
ncbi:MAG: PIN domain-containing protein [Chloroflexi bacterium]|nr:PIN domain-containing protein [Chloroflexota bacterium]